MRTTTGSKRLLILVVIATLLTAGYLSSCGKETLPECPHDWDFRKITVYDSETKQREPLQTVNGSPLLSGPGLQTNVPEFNDCQRLVIGTGEDAHYDSLYAVWARDSLGSMDDTLAIMSVLESGAAFPMVEILSIGGTYPQLKLEPGFNCLFVFKHCENWSARLVASGRKEEDCRSPRPPQELHSYPELSIKRTSAAFMKLAWKDFPAVARWDWDTNSNTQVIGFGCLDGWCEVGELGHDPETGPELTAMAGIAGLSSAGSNSPVLRVKGWYDEQRLSPAKPGWWKPGRGPRSVVGTIVPVPGLAQFESSTFANTWKPIAYVNLSEPSAEYRTQQNFSPMSSTTSVTTISFCMEDWGGSAPLSTGGCEGISQGLRQKAHCVMDPTAPTIHWWAKTIPADNPQPKYWCIVRRSAPKGVPVPGTVRWRWTADDEQIWGRCSAACCSGH